MCIVHMCGELARERGWRSVQHVRVRMPDGKWRPMCVRHFNEFSRTSWEGVTA